MAAITQWAWKESGKYNKPQWSTLQFNGFPFSVCAITERNLTLPQGFTFDQSRYQMLVGLGSFCAFFLTQMQTTIYQLGLLPNLFHGFHSVFYLSPKRGIMYMEITFL